MFKNKISNKNIIFFISFILFLVILWLVIYNNVLNSEVASAVTKDNVSEIDSWDNVRYKDAIVYISDKALDLKGIKYKDVENSDKVVKVILNDKEYKGYIAIDESISTPEVVLINEAYVEVLVPRHDD